MKPSKLDLLVANCTAFPDWKTMLKALKQGYCPTLNGGKQYAKLCGIVRRNGFKAYRLSVLA